jgi:hypothetical protein
MCTSWACHVEDCYESSRKYDMIIGSQPRSPWKIINFNDKMVTWDRDTDNIPMKDRYSSLSSSVTLIEVHLSRNESQQLGNEYSWDTKFIDIEYKQGTESLDDVLKTYENLHEEEHALCWEENRNL